jgi:hypothetical protein
MGERVLYLGMIPAAVTAGPLSGGSPILTLAGSSGAFAGEGYVLADTEVVGYTRKHQNAMNMAQLDMPVDRRGEGILRGCYGTPAAGHPNETLVVGIPFRYWDRFKPRLADSQMVCYGASKAAPGATWKSVKWTQDARDKNLEVILQARFDGSPAWDATPSARPGGLYEFSGGAGGFEVTADSIELRFLFGFGPRSFFPNHSWKRVPTVLSVAVEYEQPTRTLYHEER